MAPSTFRRSPTLVTLATAYAEQADAHDTPDTLVIPEDLTALSDEELEGLRSQAQDAFAALYGDGEDLTTEDLQALESLTEGIEALSAEHATREAAAAERRETAAALAARVNPDFAAEDESDEDEADDEDEDEEDEEGAVEAEAEEENAEEDAPAVVASARRETRVNLSGLRTRQAPAPVREAPSDGVPRSMRDVVMAAPDVPGFANGQGMDFSDLGRAVNSRLMSFNAASYEAARRAGRHLRQQFGVATIAKPFDRDLVIDSTDPESIEEVFSRATDQSRLPGGSLVASGGWCAPSETLYDLFETETRDGLVSLPEVGISRGGIKFTPGPDFTSIYNDIVGFAYTEEEDIAGDYDGEGGGSKPCYKVECPEFQEVRLGTEGLCITAGLLQRRGYPEVIARTIRGALVAHDHRLAAKKIAALVDGSTAVAMPSDQVGATAPILTSIELQAQHYRYVHRLGDNAVLEAIFPRWVRGAIRADLSRRLGVDLISVSNSRIEGWFRDAGLNAQFVYNYQDLTGDADEMTSYPTEVEFLLYAAGTWVIGGADVITLDTVYDSVLLGENDYTALFTEEGWLAAKRGHDSRAITVPFCANGATAAGVEIDCDGTDAA